jgi:hypothetical protein
MTKHILHADHTWYIKITILLWLLLDENESSTQWSFFRVRFMMALHLKRLVSKTLDTLTVFVLFRFKMDENQNILTGNFKQLMS